MAFAEDYVDVATRITLFREKYPEASLQPVDPSEPIRIITVGDKTFLQYVAAAYRNPDDPRPGIGVAWEPFPGRTPYTRDSEAMVAETSAWGRAIVAVLAADTKRGVASADEVRNRHVEKQPPPSEETLVAIAQLLEEADAADSKEAVAKLWREASDAGWMGVEVNGEKVGDRLTSAAERVKAAAEQDAAAVTP